ncbi:hypothetical protein SD71_10780 [Cohnella kolymensis]|uniref:Uncharacterized protein n=1 Tax=Cohnella kolymensis TaxID=1590652 RepID=A0ABR5A493_9BACL|nr:hypothetical protein SD71_10780 [Cohnella kolymensis]
MAITGEQVFNIAVALLDEIQTSASYRQYAPSVLTTLQAELLPKTETPTVIADLAQPLSLPDSLCLQALPYGLAAHLMIIDNPNDQGKAAFFNARYDELKSKRGATITPITDVYSVGADGYGTY